MRTAAWLGTACVVFQVMGCEVGMWVELLGWYPLASFDIYSMTLASATTVSLTLFPS